MNETKWPALRIFLIVVGAVLLFANGACAIGLGTVGPVPMMDYGVPLALAALLVAGLTRFSPKGLTLALLAFSLIGAAFSWLSTRSGIRGIPVHPVILSSPAHLRPSG